MTRLVQWLRLWRWWFAAHHTLVATTVRAVEETVIVRADYEAELLAREAAYDEGMALQRKTVDQLRTDCERWESLWAETDRRRLAEVQRGNSAWQEAGIQRRRADGLQAELDRVSGVEVGRAAARD